MIKRILLYILVLVVSLGTITSTYAYKTNLQILLTVSEKWVPIKWTLVEVETWNEESNNTITTKQLTDDKWQILLKKLFDSDEVFNNEFRLNINWNNVYITDVKWEIKAIDIDYDQKKQIINKVDTWWNSSNEIHNQEIKVDTNWVLLTFFIFITMVILTIFLGWRIMYTKLLDDVRMHRKFEKWDIS